MVLALLPVLALALLVPVMRPHEQTWRAAVVAAAIIWAVLVVAATELLSSVHALDRPALAVFWAGAAVVLGALLWRQRRPERSPFPGRLGTGDWWLVGGATAVVVIVGVTGFLAAPNTVDSLVYHVARVAHWVQNQTVDHYATPLGRQLDQPPLAEYGIAHLQALAAGDRFAFSVQWLAWLGCCANASLIAFQLRANVTAQVIAAVFVATLPMAVLQGSSTQNDLVAAFWISSLVTLVLAASADRERFSWGRSAAIGATVALAVLTKGTAVVFVLPILVWFGWICWRGLSVRALGVVACAGAVALVLVTPHFARIIDTYGSYANPNLVTLTTNRDPGVDSALSNVARNLAIEVATPSSRVNENVILRPVRTLHDALGIDVNDPRSTLSETNRFSVPRENQILSENSAPNPLHLVLLLGALVLVVARRSLRESLGPLALVVLVCAALFCILFRWQTYNNRLHLPIFVIGAPIVAIAIASLLRRWMVLAVGGLLLVAAVPWTFFNTTRPILGAGSVVTTSRSSSYFAGTPSLELSYRSAARAARAGGCERIGLRQSSNDPEYLFWELLAPRAGASRRMEHVHVVGATEELEDQDFHPCAVVDTFGAALPEWPKTLVVHGRRYARVSTSPVVSVYRRPG